MATTYTIRGLVADGDYESEPMNQGHRQSYFYLTFFDADGNDVAPAAGTVAIMMKPHRVWRMVSDGLFAAPDVYTIINPSAAGLGNQVTIALSGVQGAVSFALDIARW